MRFLTASVCVLCVAALAAVKAELKNMLKTIGCYGVIYVCAVLDQTAKSIQSKRKSHRKRDKKHAKNTMPRKLERTPKRHRFGNSNAS